MKRKRWFGQLARTDKMTAPLTQAASVAILNRLKGVVWSCNVCRPQEFNQENQMSDDEDLWDEECERLSIGDFTRDNGHVFCIDVSEPVAPLNQDSTQVEIPDIECPECGGKLFASVHEWDVETGRPTTCGIQIDCENENWNDEGTDHNHRWFQSDWQRIVDKVNQWAKAVEL